MKKLTINEPRKIERQINKLINSDPEGKFMGREIAISLY